MNYKLATGTAIADDSPSPRIIAVRRASALPEGVESTHEPRTIDEILLRSDHAPRHGEACVVVVLAKHATAYRAIAEDPEVGIVRGLLKKVLRW